MKRVFYNGEILAGDMYLRRGAVFTDAGRITAISQDYSGDDGIDLQGRLLVPGFIDLHVHGGDGADFMDGTEEAFRTVCRAHARHGTTALLATTTVARHDQHMRFLEVCRSLHEKPTGGAMVAGAHFYGPYFGEQARGCHPAEALRPPVEAEYHAYLEFADIIRTATVAPELPGAGAFVRACLAKGIRCNAGHSHATFDQIAEAVRYGIRHVDHLFCAMSDRARLRQTQTYPMRGGLMEATLYFDELTTEVIADGKHLAPELLRLALKVKGPNRLAIVTDANRALDMPDGEYLFGSLDGGEPIRRVDDVGVTLDGLALASGVMGMDTGVRTMLNSTGCSLHDAIRMASLTPARIAGLDADRGSIEVGKRADFVVLDLQNRVKEVYIGGERVVPEAI
jgi:N-acetylglucosamine-6-phosphate deacetylase